MMGYRELPASKHRPSNLRPICGSPPNHIDTRIDADQTPAPKLSNDFGGHGGVCDAQRILQHRDSLEQEGQPKRRKQPVDEQFQRHARDRCCFAAPALGGSEAGESGILGPGVSSTSSTAKANPRSQTRRSFRTLMAVLTTVRRYPSSHQAISPRSMIAYLSLLL